MSQTTRQSDIAVVFRRSQQWVSQMQTRSIDPMPRDMDAAVAWGRRLGFMPESPVAEPASVPAETLGVSALELEERRLKSLRADEIQLRLDLQSGRLLRREDVEQRETVNAAEFRHAACEYPLRARAVIERYVTDAALVDRIMSDLQPLAAELLNRSDPTAALRGKTAPEIRAILLRRVDDLCQILS